MQNAATIRFHNQQITCAGEWNIPNIATLEKLFASIAPSKQYELVIDGAEITKMDTAGAWLICQFTQQFPNTKFANFSAHTAKLIAIVQQSRVKQDDIPKIHVFSWLEKVGKSVVEQAIEFHAYLTFVGKLSIESLRIIRRPAHIRWQALLNNIYGTGYRALSIIGLLSFMIGVVLTYQMGVQLRNYGANIFIVDLLGLSILREFGPLLTAIMVAGRTGSAFTAELGLMKANQEINALDTIGVTPTELLLLPKIVGLFIALPLLTIWSDIFGILGGMVMANNMLGLSWYDFLHRFQHQIPLKALLIGLGKAPVFALIIASIGCFQGISVRDSADSIGKNTTKSVVYSIFFIIVADALFSIIFSRLKI